VKVTVVPTIVAEAVPGAAGSAAVGPYLCPYRRAARSIAIVTTIEPTIP
jgi:hypothetical protein